MIDLLTKVPDLRVPARTSSFYFMGKNEKIADLAKELRELSPVSPGIATLTTSEPLRLDRGH